MSRLFFFVLLGVSIWGAHTSKILAVFPMPSYSHFQLGFRLAKELADRGHQVTAISPFPPKETIGNFTHISVEELVPLIDEFKKNLFDMTTFNPLKSIKFMLNISKLLVQQTYSNKKVQKLMNSDEKFDVMIMEHFVNDALLGLAHHFKAPSILIGSMGASNFNNYLFANPSPSSYVPNLYGSFTSDMTFSQRVQNFLINIFDDLTKGLLLIPHHAALFKKFIKTDVEFEDILYNVSLILTNSHPSVNEAIPHVPNMIEIGGFHIKPPQKLPEDLQKFLDEAEEGVILFSMGSNLKSKDLKPETRNSLLKAFSKIKQRVLWKFEDDLNTPKNVKIMNWLPQQDVLGHPNVVAFISHGGLLSTTEAVHFGVPIIGIPVFGDQKTNMGTAAKNGYAVTVPLMDITEEKLSWALNEIVNNTKYRENVKRRSRVMNDQPMKPIDTAVYWVEHVIRHQGAPYFRSAGLNLRWYQRHMVDIIVFLGAVTVVVFVIFYIIIKKILGVCFGKPKVSKSKKNK